MVVKHVGLLIPRALKNAVVVLQQFIPPCVLVPVKFVAVASHLQDTGIQRKPGTGKPGRTKLLWEQQEQERIVYS